jgi:hypothetical protein
MLFSFGMGLLTLYSYLYILTYYNILEEETIHEKLGTE